jgi:peptidoglycan hydrolase-like protein with peptidoglycan-binding domain
MKHVVMKANVVAIILLLEVIGPSWSQDLPGPRQPGGAVPHKPEAGKPPPQQGMAGMSQEKIKRVEEALQERGHNPGRIDGFVDEQTLNALREFQKLNHLSVTGVLDEQTAEKLGIDREKSAPPPKKEAPGFRG